MTSPLSFDHMPADELVPAEDLYPGVAPVAPSTDEQPAEPAAADEKE